MEEIKETVPTTFFKEVAGHNLERFHSECIAWVLNKIKAQDPNNEIFKKFNAGEDFYFLKAVTEVQDHDIVLLYTNGKKFKYIFIENKTKSTLSRKHWVHKDDHKQVGTKVIEPFNHDSARVFISNGMLQTAYYQLRWLVNKNNSTYKNNLFKEKSFKYFFLSPESRQNLKEFTRDPSYKEELYIEKLSEEFEIYWSSLGKNNKERSSVFSDRFTDPEWVILSQMKKPVFKKLYDKEENLNKTLSNLGIELKNDNKINDWEYLTYNALFDDFKPIEDENFDNEVCIEYIKYVTDEEFEKLKKEKLKTLLELKKDIINKTNITPTIEVGSANSSEPSIDITYDWKKTIKDYKFDIKDSFQENYNRIFKQNDNTSASIFACVRGKLDLKFSLYEKGKIITCALYKQDTLRFGFKSNNYHNATYKDSFTKEKYIEFVKTEILGCDKDAELFDKLESFIGLNKEKYIIKRSTPPRTLSSYSFTIEKKDDSSITDIEHVNIAVAIKNTLPKNK
jgi:hypothetical protein